MVQLLQSPYYCLTTPQRRIVMYPAIDINVHHILCLQPHLWAQKCAAHFRLKQLKIYAGVALLLHFNSVECL